MTTAHRSLALIAAGVLVAGAACTKVDFFLFASDPASLEDYDFTSPELDGIPPSRITSQLISSADPKEKIHVIFVERDVSKLDPRLDPDDDITVLFSHGNRGNMLLYYYRAGYFEDMGFNVLLYDYRGYGASDGQTTEDNIYEDAAVVYDFLRARSDVGRIVSVGYSLGGGPAIWLCSPQSGRAVAACFTEAAFASTDKLIDDASGYDFEGSWFVDAVFDNAGRVETVTVPYLLMHGTADQRVGFENGEILWQAVADNHPVNRFYAVEGASHRNVPLPSYQGTEEPREYSHPDEIPPALRPDYELYRSRIVHFLAAALAEPQRP